MMKHSERSSQLGTILHAIVVVFCAAILSGHLGAVGWAWAEGESPTPLLEAGHPVDWWFVFKFNAKSFPGCGGSADERRECLFGGEAQNYTFGQQFVYAS